MSMVFQAGDIFIDNRGGLVETNMVGDTKLLLSTGVNLDKGGACLGIYTGTFPFYFPEY